ncbi:MAG: OmpA family protein, partial [Bacteroidetes bacterium]|nr:OmpA family protein [Bacteroidota bacterium]
IKDSIAIDSAQTFTTLSKTDSAQVNNKPAEVKKTETSSIRGLHKGQVFFSLGSSKIRTSEEEVLNEVKQIMEANPALQLVLKGFADPSGNAQRNLILSQKRAEAVAEYLVSRGIERDRIDTTSLGDKIQKYGEAALDRRVELILVWE